MNTAAGYTPQERVQEETTMSENRPCVVIVGAGFGGLAAARALDGSSARVLILDRNNYHTFLPLLYELAAAELEANEISYPVRSIVRKLGQVSFVMAEVTRVDLNSRAIETDGRPIDYDYLVLAMGSEAHYFGVEGAAEFAFPLYSLDQGLVLRNHILRSLEEAVREPDGDKRKEMLTFAIVGGGPTGVEFAGALAELIQGPVVKDYPTIAPGEIQVVLLEATDRVLSFLPERLGIYTQRRLTRMGVQVRLGAMVTRITPRTLELRDGSILATRSVVWTAGVRGDAQVQSWGLPTTRAGHVPVLPTLQVPGHPEVYVVGDLAYLEQEGRRVPMIAPVAVSQGKRAGKNILRQMAQKTPEAYHYRDQGATVTIGRNAGVVRIGGLSFTGFFAWLAWLVVHLVKLIGFRNRLFVLINWAWDYFFFERASRLILPRDLSPPSERQGESLPPDTHATKAGPDPET
jgi:NADH dehydrogenase